ncbi:MAG: ABC transporter permease [Anaerolineae bacterium]|nr:ABC transporter permease [Anaerolineae bacterium]
MTAQSLQAQAQDIARLEADGQMPFKSQSLLQTALRRLRKDYLTLFALGTLSLLTLLAVFAPQIEDLYDVSYTRPNAQAQLLPPGADGHPLGTDNLGRDILARLLYGGRVSLFIGISAAIFSTMLGVTLGLISGYYQGGPLTFIDDFIMWFITTLNSIPTLLLLILLTSVLRPDISTLIAVLTIVTWTGTMRLIRGEAMVAREQEYIVSARAMGASALRIMFVHILPNTISVLVTSLAIQVGSIILIESALSFLGLGVRPPEPSWGNMLTQAQAYFRQAPHMSIFPGIMIVITVLSLYLIGDGLRDAFDPRSRK